MRSDLKVTVRLNDDTGSHTLSIARKGGVERMEGLKKRKLQEEMKGPWEFKKGGRRESIGRINETHSRFGKESQRDV